MSRITDVIVCFFGPRNFEERRVEEINSIMEKWSHNAFKRVDQHAGGEKVFCSCVLLGSFNHLCFQSLLFELEELSWEDFYFAWVMKNDEDDRDWEGPFNLKKSIYDELPKHTIIDVECPPDKIVSEVYEVTDL